MAEELVHRIDTLAATVDTLATTVDSLTTTVDTLATTAERRFDTMELRFDELGREMRVLHEEVISRLKALPEESVPTRSEMRQADAELREAVERRLDPLEAVVRDHSRQIERLSTKQR